MGEMIDQADWKPVSLAEAKAVAGERQALAEEIKALLIERLELDLPITWIGDDQPLFGRGLELDSLDALELTVAVEQFTGVTLDDGAVGLFGSINAIVDYVLDPERDALGDAVSVTGAVWSAEGDLGEW